MAKPKEKKTIFGFKKQSHAMWIGMIVFSSVWMFVLGVFVGRGTAPVRFDIEELQKELISLKETVLKKEKERFKALMESAQKTTDLGFYEALKTPSEDKDFPDSRDDASSESLKPAKAALEPVSEEARHKTQPFSIQVASLRSLEDAERLAARLRKQGYTEIYRTIGDIPGKGTWHRIRIGYFSSKSEAESVIKQMRKDGYKPFLVKR